MELDLSATEGALDEEIRAIGRGDSATSGREDARAVLANVREVFNAWDDEGFGDGGLDRTNRLAAWAEIRAALAPKGLT